jgi:hypothetical protein
MIATPSDTLTEFQGQLDNTASPSNRQLLHRYQRPITHIYGGKLFSLCGLKSFEACVVGRETDTRIMQLKKNKKEKRKKGNKKYKKKK